MIVFSACDESYQSLQIIELLQRLQIPGTSPGSSRIQAQKSFERSDVYELIINIVVHYS
jgi:hypothetical protein